MLWGARHEHRANSANVGRACIRVALINVPLWTHNMHTAATHHSNHNHQISVNFPENAPPTLTPRRKGCACTLSILALIMVLLFLTLLTLEAPFIALENSRIAARMRAAPYRRDHPPTSGSDPIQLGLWDENKLITSLQLIVCFSLALGIDERHVDVTAEGSHFYRITVVREGSWVLEAINADGSMFLDALNAQAARFGAKLVVSHVARRADDPPPTSPPP